MYVLRWDDLYVCVDVVEGGKKGKVVDGLVGITMG